LERHERGSLTVWGETFSAQARRWPGNWGLAVTLKAGAPRDAEGAVILPPGDLAKLRALLDEMDLRSDAVLGSSPFKVCRRCATTYVGAEGHHCQAIALAE